MFWKTITEAYAFKEALINSSAQRDTEEIKYSGGSSKGLLDLTSVLHSEWSVFMCNNSIFLISFILGEIKLFFQYLRGLSFKIQDHGHQKADIIIYLISW